ncbi:FAD-dependent oxidoreductase [Paenibacillus chitinolyticus]|uniref:FAD-dependent oxidoreductase n=1 Tax=Paenibacillus chitinolyticus TaxID=79263 RepID=UPI00364DABDB
MSGSFFTGKKGLLLVLVLVLLAGAGGGWYYYSSKWKAAVGGPLPAKQELTKVVSVDKLKDNYDVIVVGTDPEGVSAAVSASRNGLKTLLIEPRKRTVLGGLMTEGWLNSIDMNWDKTVSTLPGNEPEYFNQGIFKEWYEKIEGHSFDVTTAANAFNKLVTDEKNLDVSMDGYRVEPILKQEGTAQTVTGITVTKQDGTKQTIGTKTVIDATQDADFAAAAGVPFTIGREDIGDKKARMAVTAVFRLKNVTDEVWSKVAKRLNGDNDKDTGLDKMSAWGYGKEMAGYVPLNKERTKMRGLNIGRQLDGTVLINALHIFNIDGLNAKSQQEGLEIAAKEIPNVVKFLNTFDEFKNVELDSIAPELYVRETRHMKGLYRLSVVDLLENRDQWDRIAFGSYPADIQRTSPNDNGAIVVHPTKYAVPFRSIVPQNVDGLLVVGRSASYDTLAHGSARVIPVGMAEGEAAGAAAKLAGEKGATFRAMAESKSLIEELQKRLNDQGMDLKPYKLDEAEFMKHKAYPGLKAAVSMGIAYGSYANVGFKELDKPSNAQRIVNQMNSVRRMYFSSFPGEPSAAVKGMEEPAKKTLTLQQASYTIALAAGLKVEAAEAQAALESGGLLSKATLGIIANKEKLSDGDVYMMLKDAVEKQAGAKF